MGKVQATCSRCGDTVSVHRVSSRERVSLSGGWRRLSLRKLGAASSDGKDRTLCPTCVRLLEHWFGQGKRESEPKLWIAEPVD